MKILLDTCVYGGVRKTLRDAEYDVTWSGDWLKDPGDEEILAIAYREGRTLVTLDKDFGELAIVFKKAHCGIVRLVNLSSQQQATICIQVLKKYGQALQQGAIVTADVDRLRFRPPDGDQ